MEVIVLLAEPAGEYTNQAGRLSWHKPLPGSADIHETRGRLKQLGFEVSDIEERDCGQTEFFLTDDGYSHCFGVATNA